MCTSHQPLNGADSAPLAGCPQYGCAENHPAGHDESDGECVRCGEWTTYRDRAEVADGLVHASCMEPGEPIA